MQVRVIYVAEENSEQLFHKGCADGKGYDFETNNIPHHVGGFPESDSEACCYNCRGFLGHYNAKEQELRRAVFRALDNSVTNGYTVDENAGIEALELIASDSTIEELFDLRDESPEEQATPQQVRMVESMVLEWKNSH